MPELDPAHSKLLGALTITAVTHLGEDSGVVDAEGQLRACRVVRLGDVALIDVPADDRGPRCINCYSIDVERFDAIHGEKFEVNPQHLIYSRQWKHKGYPPDLHLTLVQELPEQWVSAASLVLLGALRRWAPHAIDWDSMQDVLPVLDAFEAAMDSKIARRH